MEHSHLACLRAALAANQALLRLTINQAIASAKERGKADTLGLDADPEGVIVREILRHLDDVLILAEEQGQILKGGCQRWVVIVDPTDGSVLLLRFLKNYLETDGDQSTTVGEIVWSKGAKEEWERIFGGPAIVTGAHAALTCVEEGVPTFSVILNYITQSLIMASAEGVYHVVIPRESAMVEEIDVEALLAHGEAVTFPPLKCPAGPDGRERQYVTYLGKEDYRLHWQEWGPGSDPPAYPCQAVAGPGRILYLSHLCPHPLGYVAANGEKISEWAHWLTFSGFARDQGQPALTVYEVNMKARIYSGLPMATSQEEKSLFHPDRHGRMRMDFGRLDHLANRSHYRATLVVAPTDNQWLRQIMTERRHRPLGWI